MTTPRLRRTNRGKGHSYTLDGERVLGVTTIIDALAKPALVAWAGGVTADYAIDNWDTLADMALSERHKLLKGAQYQRKSAAAVQGTRVHQLASALVAGERIDVPDELAGHVDSYVRFLDRWQPEPLLVETPVYNAAVPYAGTLDLVATMPDGRTWLLDVKTGKGVYGETGLQLSAYANAERYLGDDGAEHDMPHIDAVGVIHTRADGFDVYPLPHTPAIFLLFRHLAYVASRLDGMRDWVGESLPAPQSVSAA